MRIRRRKYEDVAPSEFLLLRQELGLPRYRKTAQRDEEKRALLMDLWLKRIEEREQDDYILIGPRRRRLKILGFPDKEVEQ